jgi:hypothetical protein
MNVSKKLILWQKAKLLDSEQAQRILSFEQEHQFVWPWFWSVILLGVFCISLGGISIVAANWNAIPTWCKLSVQTLFLAGFATTAVYQMRQNKMWLFETCIIALFMFSGTAVAIVAQVFQNNASLSVSAFWWCLMTCPILWLSRHQTVTFMWLIVALYGMICSQTGQLLLVEVLSWPTVQAYPEVLWVLPVLTTIFLGVVCSFGQQKVLNNSAVWQAGLTTAWIGLFATLILAMLFALAVNPAAGIRIYAGIIILLGAINLFARKKTLLGVVKLSRFLLYAVWVCIYIRAFGSLLITGTGFVVNGAIIVISAIIGRQIAVHKKEKNNVADAG